MKNGWAWCRLKTAKSLTNQALRRMENDRLKLAKNQPKESTGEILRDNRQNGKPRKWWEYKRQSLAISTALSFFDELKKYASKVADCGSFLKFSSCSKGHYKRLLHAIFCHYRLCVLCQWRKSLAMYHQVLQLVHAHREHYKSDIPLLLTLTVPNLPENELKQGLKDMKVSFSKLMKRRPVKRVARSWFRSLEITYNAERGDYHPHFHVLLLVPENYFKRARGLYIERDTWLSMWQEATGVPEITQVDIKRVRKKNKRTPLEAVTAEVAKYATKPSNYVEEQPTGEFSANKEVVKVLDDALRRQRLVAFGGLFVRLRKELKLKDIEQADLVNITGEDQPCTCPICQSTLIDEMYKWHMGVRDYVG